MLLDANSLSEAFRGYGGEIADLISDLVDDLFSFFLLIGWLVFSVSASGSHFCLFLPAVLSPQASVPHTQLFTTGPSCLVSTLENYKEGDSGDCLI